MHIQFDKNGMPSDYIIPKTVFKYHRANDNLLNLIEKSEMLFSKPATFNDPYDCSNLIYNTENTSEEIEAYFIMYYEQMNPGVEPDLKVREWAKKNANRENLIAYLNIISNAMPSTVGVSCFSTINNSMLMWSHYSDGHKGVCLAFDYPLLIESTQSVSIEIEYTDKHHTFNIVKEKLASKNNHVQFQYLLDKKMFGTKSLFWSYENEFRLLNFNPGIVKFDSKALKEIILGINVDRDISKIITELIKRIGREDIEIKQATKVDNKSEIKIPASR